MSRPSGPTFLCGHPREDWNFRAMGEGKGYRCAICSRAYLSRYRVGAHDEGRPHAPGERLEVDAQEDRAYVAACLQQRGFPRSDRLPSGETVLVYPR